MAKKIVSCKQTQSADAKIPNAALTALTLNIPRSIAVALDIESLAFEKSGQEIAIDVLRNWALRRIHACDLYARINKEVANG